MALKFKKPFGPGITPLNRDKLRKQELNRSLAKGGLRLQKIRGGAFDIRRIKKGKQVSTPRRTSRGISF